MTIDAKLYNRKTFQVRAVQITPENMKEVAKWCHGRIRQSSEVEWWDQRREGAFIQLKETEGRKSIATVGCWVLRRGYNDYRAYSDQSFRGTFQLDKTDELRDKIHNAVSMGGSDADIVKEIMKLIREEQA